VQLFFVVDGKEGPTFADEAIAEWLRQQPVPVLLAVNVNLQNKVQFKPVLGDGLRTFPVSGILWQRH